MINNLTLKFIVPGTPIAKGRARVSSAKGFIRHYTPQKTVNYETLVRKHAFFAMAQSKSPIIETACAMAINLYMPIPIAWSKKKKEQAEKGAIRPETKPDCSNVAKAIEDAMNGVVFTDDKLICDLHIKKFYSESPRAEVSVFMIEKEKTL